MGRIDYTDSSHCFEIRQTQFVLVVSPGLPCLRQEGGGETQEGVAGNQAREDAVLNFKTIKDKIQINYLIHFFFIKHNFF